MGMNFQDVLRDVHDPVNHALQTSNGGATIFAVVNTVAAGQASVVLDTGVNWIGLATIDGNVNILGNPTVTVGNPTLYAVVNTAVAGVGNSMVTINPRVDYIGLMSVSGNVNVGTPTVFLGTPTLNAVVNIPSSIAITGNVTLSDPKTYIGSVSVSHAAWADPKTFVGLVTASNGLAWSDPKTYIGLTTAYLANLPALPASSAFIGIVTVTNQQPLVASTVNIGSVSILGGGIGLNAGLNGIGFATVKIDIGTKFIGLTTSVNGTSTANIGSVSVLGGTIGIGTGTLNIGSVSVLGGGIGLNAGVNAVGFATVYNAIGSSFIGLVSIQGNVNLNAGVNSVGFATVNIVNSWADPKTFIGLATTVNGAGTQFIGLVTAWTRNAGTSKTLVNLPVAMSIGSIATIAVPTNANTMYITNLLLNSDATVRINILSGVTYLNGNASIGITLNPGGGWVETGASDSPTYIGCPSGAIVVQKFDMTATSANISGKLVYFQE